jgi:tRNA pseudouridine55 synthase
MVLPPDMDESAGMVLLVDKPRGWTSFDVANKVRGLLHCRKVGHAGTLDPMATGLLIVCTGRKTKEVERYQGLEKEYEVEMMLGATTESYDAETPVVATRSTAGITDDMVRTALSRFVGAQTQVPPMWSAVKVGGRRLYRYARKGEQVERPVRQVVVHAIEPIEIAIPKVGVRVVCSKGTYVRSLVHDVGAALGCGAHVTALRRTRIGTYRVQDAASIDELVQWSNSPGRAAGRLEATA